MAQGVRAHLLRMRVIAQSRTPARRAVPSNGLRLVLLPVIFVAIHLDVLAWADVDDEIRALVIKLKDERDDVAQVAVEALTKIGLPTIGPLTEYVSRERSCFGRLNALLVLTELDRENPLVAPALKRIVVSPCSISPWKDIAQRQEAALLMGKSGRGVRELARLLRGHRRFVRRSAIWVFDEVAETIDHAPPDVIEAVRESLPAVAAATKDGDRIVREVAWEVLDELSAAPQSAVCREARSIRGSLGGSLLPQNGLDGCEPAYQAFERADYETALPGLLILAEKGEARAMYHLSEMYFAGLGVSKSTDRGDEWLARSAEHGYPRPRPVSAARRWPLKTAPLQSSG